MERDISRCLGKGRKEGLQLSYTKTELGKGRSLAQQTNPTKNKMIFVLFWLFQSFLIYFCVLPLLGVLVGYLIERLSLCGLRRSSGLWRLIGYRNIEILQPGWNALVKTTAAVSIVHAFIVLDGVSTSNSTFMYSSTEKMGIPVQFFVRLLCFSVGLGLGSALQPVGLTGGIACGKSTVSKIISEDPR